MVLSKGQKRERPSMRLNVLLGFAANSWGGGAVEMRHSVAKQAMFTPGLGGVKKSFHEYVTSGFFLCLGKNITLLVKGKLEWYFIRDIILFFSPGESRVPSANGIALILKYLLRFKFRL